MGTIKYIDSDFAKFYYTDRQGKNKKVYLAFGDQVEVLESSGSKTKIRPTELWDGTVTGTVNGTPFRDRSKGVLKFSMVDVQQGDGMVLETPPDQNDQTKIVLIDGGDNKLFARHVAARYQHRKSSPQKPLDIELMVITHGDADHFSGLNYLLKSETEHISKRKKIYLKPKKVFHNGLVKTSGKLNGVQIKDEEMFGETVEVNGITYALNLYDDQRDSPELMRNDPFSRWIKTVDTWEKRRGNPIEMKRIAFGMDENVLFGNLAPLKFEIQGPFEERVEKDGQNIPALRFFKKPPKSSIIHVSGPVNDATQVSASHTINGHSIALRITYGNVRFNLTGDLNQESMALMKSKLEDLNKLEAEIVKAPHHGSADFDLDCLRAMNPVVTLVSSGDESARKEHIHPRATLMAALGKVSRGETSILLCTELVSFFRKMDYSHQRKDLASYFKDSSVLEFLRDQLHTFFKSKTLDSKLPTYYGFERTNFGIIHIRTDGERILVFTHSGKEGMREAYSFNVDSNHQVTFNHEVSIK